MTKKRPRAMLRIVQGGKMMRQKRHQSRQTRRRVVANLVGKRWGEMTRSERNRLLKIALQDLGFLDEDGIVMLKD